jgi:hypothetical protein
MKDPLFIDIDKDNYKDLVGIDNTHPFYYSIAFISDGSGFITRGHLFCTSSYFLNVVDSVPEKQEENTIYLVKE